MESILSVINGLSWVVVSMAVYALSMVFTTEMVKRIRFIKPEWSLPISWIVGVGCFFVVYKLFPDVTISLHCVAMFVVLTFAMNKAYAGDWLRLKSRIREIFSLLRGTPEPQPDPIMRPDAEGGKNGE